MYPYFINYISSFQLILNRNSFKFFFREAFLFDYFYKIILINWYFNWIIKGSLIFNFNYFNAQITKFLWDLYSVISKKTSILFNSNIKLLFASVILIITIFFCTILTVLVVMI